MARARKRKTSWVGLGLGLVGLSAAGFVLGIVAGITAKEPEIVLGHIAGRSSHVPWDVAAAPPPEGQVPTAAAPTEADADRTRPLGAPHGAPQPAARLGTEPGASVAAPGDGAFSIQVGAFDSSQSAEALVSALQGKGLPVYLTPAPSTGDGRWRVRVGPYALRDQAERVAVRLKREEGLPTWVLSEERG